MKINRAWAMPNKETFKIKPIYDLIMRTLKDTGRKCLETEIVDPFVRNSPYKRICSISNDLDPEIEATYNMDALEFLRKKVKTNTVDVLFYDPPYSPRQVSESYRKLGMSVNMQTTQSSFWGNIKKRISKVVKKDGVVISC